jgi:hypothetical protein
MTTTSRDTLALVCEHRSGDLAGLTLRRWQLAPLGPGDVRVAMAAASTKPWPASKAMPLAAQSATKVARLSVSLPPSGTGSLTSARTPAA